MTHAFHRTLASDHAVYRGNFPTEEGLVSGTLTTSGDRILEYDLGGSESEPDLPSFVPGFYDFRAGGLEFLKAERTGIRPAAARSFQRFDAILATTGVTHPLTTIMLENPEGGGHALQAASDRVRLLESAQKVGVPRVPHRVHLLCELTNDGVAEQACELIAERHPAIALVSLMDHSPGPGQFKTYECWCGTIAARLGHHAARIALLGCQRREASASRFQERAGQVTDGALAYGFPVAAHDLESPVQVHFACEIGATICEFPMNVETTCVAAAGGQFVVAGASNIVNGGSHVGNVSALDLMKAVPKLALTYDYAPGSLAQAWSLLNENNGAFAACQATAGHASRVLAQNESGQFCLGARADLVVVCKMGEFVLVQAVWQRGAKSRSAVHRLGRFF